MKKTVSLILALITLLFCLVGCNNSKDIVLTDEDIHTDYEGVYITLSSVDTSGEHKKLNVVWHNETNQEFTFGEDFYIEILENDEWKSVLTEDMIVTSIANLFPAKSTKERTYSTEYFDLSKEGTYRVRCVFSPGDGKMYNTWVAFEVKASDGTSNQNHNTKLVDLDEYATMTKNGTTSIEVGYTYVGTEETVYEFVIEDAETIDAIMSEVFKMELKEYPDDQDISFYWRVITVHQGTNAYLINLAEVGDGQNRYLCESQNLRNIIEQYIEDNLME